MSASATPSLSGLARPASTAGRILITPATEQKLRADLERLRHEVEVVFAARIREARSTGDGSSGDDHLQIREEEAVVRSEVSRIEALLASAIVVEEGDSADGTAAIGSIVEVRDVESGKTYRHLITGDYDRGTSDEKEIRAVSASSPVGQALLGVDVGAEAEVELPNGRKRKLEVVAVAPAHGTVATDPAPTAPPDPA